MAALQRARRRRGAGWVGRGVAGGEGSSETLLQLASSTAAAIAVSPDARRGTEDQNGRTPAPRRMGNDMGWFVFEALVAAGVLLFMVWWTMFSGRRRDEHRGDDEPPGPPGAG
jgi:hypothetical protein